MERLLCPVFLVLLALPSFTGLDTDLHILVTDWKQPGRIFLVTLGSINTIRAVANGTRPFAVDFDPEEEVIYWTDTLQNQIRSTSLKGLGDKVIISLNPASTPEGLAIDSATRQIFYTDFGNKHIAVLDMNGTNHKIIVNETSEKPRGIILHQEKRSIYWTAHGNTPVIATADYDGANRRDIVTSGSIWPNGLALDKKKNKLYWCDGHLNTIESVGVDGTGRQVLYRAVDSRFFDIFLHSDVLYFTDWNTEYISIIDTDRAPVNSIGQLSNAHMSLMAGIHVYSSVDYSGCPRGTHGPTCEACMHTCKGNSCEKTTGTCLHGCKPGYRGLMCDANCDSGSYGDKCNSTCGMCVGDTCHHVTGSCPSGCKPGFYGSRCDQQTGTACPSKMYGSPCTSCGHCVGGVACDVVTGDCLGGCQPGWIGDRCDIGCNQYEYSSGPVCRQCGHCEWGVMCDKGTGACPAGCKPGWRGSKCDNTCASNTYGSPCTPCGHCVGGVACDVVTGNCPGGCQPGWIGDRCDTACKSDEYSFVSACRPCGHCEGGVVCDRGTGECHTRCQNGWKGLKCDIADVQTDQGSQNPENGPYMTVVSGATSAGLFVVLVIALIAIVIYIRRKKTPRTQTLPAISTTGAVNPAYIVDPPPGHSVDQFQWNDPGYTRLARPPPTPCCSPSPEPLYAEAMPVASLPPKYQASY